MRVLHLWRGDAPNAGGGGAGSMFRLSQSLRMAGIDSRILCETKTTDEDWVRTKSHPSFGERVLKQFTSRVGLNDIHRVSSHRLHEHPEVQGADVLNFHGTHGGFFSYLAFPKLSEHKAVVFTLRDLWALTGHCAFPMSCERWQTGCGSCPDLKTHPPVKRDATALEWRMKNSVYARSDLTMVALSEWVATQARLSMLQRFPIHTIPNGVDTEVYRPLDKAQCRYALGIEPDQRVLMFVSTNLSSERKGADLLIEAIRAIPRALRKDMVCLVIGSRGRELLADADIGSVDLGYVRSDRLKAVAYSAADVYVSPSRGETFGQTLLEAMSCGTPLVSFDVGPLPELVRDGVTGRTAPSFDAGALAERITELLFDDAGARQMGSRAREIAEAEYARMVEARRYEALYREIVERRATA